MACPVAAGEAAVILSAANSISSLKGKTGSAKVDAVESLMKSNAIYVSSGMGSGITSLTKIFKTSSGSGSSTTPTTPTTPGDSGTSGGTETTTPGDSDTSDGTDYDSDPQEPERPEITGPTTVVQGKSITLKYEGTGKVTWSISPEGQGVTVKNGKVTASKTAVAGTYTVTAGGETHKVTVIAKAADNSITKLSFTKAAQQARVLWLTKDNTSPTLKLSTYLTGSTKNGSTGVSSLVNWTSSKTSVAEVDYTSGKVFAKAPGTTKITARANDSSGKSASITITVKQAVTGIVITTSKGESGTVSLTAGKSLALKATLTPAKPSNKKLIWQLCDKNGKEIDSETAKTLKISVNKNTGKVTAKKGATPGDYMVKATPADGQDEDVEGEITIHIE
jgi:hypothetical protein